MEEIVKEIREARKSKDDAIIQLKDNYISFLRRECAYLNAKYKEHFGKKCYLDGAGGCSEQYIFNGFKKHFERIIFVVHKIKKNGTLYKNNVMYGVCIEHNKIVFID